MSKPNKEGWIRHRGGKCPIDAMGMVDVRFRSGSVATAKDYLSFRWQHTSEKGDIMAYRLHKPEQVEPEFVASDEEVDVAVKCRGRNCEAKDGKGHSKECLLDAAFDQGWAGPLQWRDRIRDIDSTVEALEEERVSLVQKLEAEGFRLIDPVKAEPAEDMSDWRNWMVGDEVLIYGLSEIYHIEHMESRDYEGELPVYVRGRGWPRLINIKWHSRPSA